MLTVEYFNCDFIDLFNDVKDKISNDANLIFIDQNGIKFVTQNIFNELIDFNVTDFLFFISSSVFKRFSKEESFKKYHPSMDLQEIDSATQFDMHRIVLDYYKKKIPKQNETRLYPFSIKKQSNVYGLVFGSKNIRGVEKFLRVAWDHNKMNGEANFDIDGDSKKVQMHLFDDKQYKTKLELFECALKELILSGDLSTNKDIYDYTINEGHLPGHATTLLRKMKKESLLKYNGHPCVSYDKCYKVREIKKFEVTSP